MAAPGKASIQPDPSGPVRHLLHRIYYAQRAYREKYDRWASSLPQLGLRGLSLPGMVGSPRLETTTNFFEVQAIYRDPDGRPRRWYISSDARVWSD